MKCEILGLVNSGETVDANSQTSLFQVKQLIKHSQEILYMYISLHTDKQISPSYYTCTFHIKSIIKCYLLQFFDFWIIKGSRFHH